MHFSEKASSFLAHCRSAISLSKHTFRAYASDLNDARNFFETTAPNVEITKEHLRQYIRYSREERDLKESSIKRRLATLKLLFRWLCEENIITSNPFFGLNERIRLPRRLPRTLDHSHTALLQKAVTLPEQQPDFDVLCRKTAIHLLMETGIRVGELSNISLDDLSLSDQSLMIHGKGNRQRIVYILSSVLQRMMKQYLSKRKKISANSTRLFVTGSGLDLTPPRVRKSLKEISLSAGIERHVTPHMLRHTCATRWIESGLDIRYVQKLLGHHSISTTEIYTHVSDQGLLAALIRTMGDRIR